jgi:hypothetical protein
VLPKEINFMKERKLDCKNIKGSDPICLIIVNDISISTIRLRPGSELGTIEPYDVINHFLPSESFNFRPMLIDQFLVVDTMMINKSRSVLT